MFLLYFCCFSHTSSLPVQLPCEALSYVLPSTLLCWGEVSIGTSSFSSSLVPRPRGGEKVANACACAKTFVNFPYDVHVVEKECRKSIRSSNARVLSHGHILGTCVEYATRRRRSIVVGCLGMKKKTLLWLQGSRLGVSITSQDLIAVQSWSSFTHRRLQFWLSSQYSCYTGSAI